MPLYYGTGQQPGTPTNDNATAGKVGEYVQIVADASSATVTFTNASPTVVTWTAHPFTIAPTGIVTCTVVNFTNSGGALPTGITAGTNYYAVPIDVNTFRIGSTVANALAGTFVNASSTGTGTQTGNAEVIVTTSTPFDLGGMALTAGDWDVSAFMGTDPGSGTVVAGGFIASITTTSSTLPSVSNRFGVIINTATFPASTVIEFPVSPQRYSLTATTNIFFYGNISFSVSTLKVFGGLRARRVR